MTTVINNPNSGESADSVTGFIAVIILLIVLVALFFMYGLPVMRNTETAKEDKININVTLPPADDAPPVQQ